MLNTIDDRLAKEQKLGDAAWRIDDVTGLRTLLRAAAAQGMAVLITSDHGHVVDRHGVKVEAAAPASARHRLPGGALADAEIALSGPRVVWPQPGASIVALWDADSRYTALKAGYHGGAAPAEFTIPVLAFLPFGAEPPKDWRELGDQRPAWWVPSGRRLLRLPRRPGHLRGQEGASAVQSAGEACPGDRREPRRPLRRGARPRGRRGAPDTPGRVARGGPGRGAPGCRHLPGPDGAAGPQTPKDKIEQALRALLDAGGTLPSTALAQRIGYPAARADGFAAVLRQVLNYDGVQVLETLPDGRTLRLSKRLLQEQFELG